MERETTSIIGNTIQYYTLTTAKLYSIIETKENETSATPPKWTPFPTDNQGYIDLSVELKNKENGLFK